MRNSFRIFLCGLSAVFLSGCGTPIKITSTPDQADVLSYGRLVGTTPYHTPKISGLTGGRVYDVTKDGFETQSLMLQPGSAPTRHVVLEKSIPKVNLTSKPTGADIVDREGKLIGQTPFVISVTDEEQTYILSKLSYNPKNITLTHTSPKELNVDLGTQIPGMILYELTVARDGIEVRSELVFADRDVVENSPSVRSVRRLTDLPQTRWVGEFSLFPDNPRMIMEILDQETEETGMIRRYSNLWAREISQDARLQRWTDGVYFDESPGISADGEQIYFSSSRSGKFSVFRVATGGQKGLGLVTTGATLDRFPRLSPDGKTLLWTAYVPGTTLPQIWSMDLTSSGMQAGLPMQLREGAKAQWSPDGSTLLYSVKDRNINKWKVWTMRPDGSQPTQITTTSDSNDIDPQWSPDGNYIIFSSDRGMAGGKPNYDIWIAKADGSDPKQLTTNGSHDDKPIISKDGKTVFFRSNRGLKWDIWMMEMVDSL